MTGRAISHRRRDSRGIGAARASLSPADRELLDMPEAQPVIARIAASVCEFSTVDLAEHVLLVARVAVQAKRTPFTPYGRPTL